MKEGNLLLNVLEGRWRNPTDLEGLEKEQTPEVVAVMCGDSRCQPSDVCRDPRNNVFSVRTIGNQVMGISGSLMYPIGHLQSVRLVMVVGHINCGAVTHAEEMARRFKQVVNGASIEEAAGKMVDFFLAAKEGRSLLFLEEENAINEELKPMAQFFSSINQFLKDDEKPYMINHSAANVHLQISALLRMRQVKEKVEKGELSVAGLFYDFVGKLGKKGAMYLINKDGIPQEPGNASIVSLQK